MLKYSLAIFGTAWIYCSSTWAATSEACDAESIAAMISDLTKVPWNKGSVRAWDVTGSLWSMPISIDPKQLAISLKDRAEKNCSVHIFATNSLTLRVIPKAGVATKAKRATESESLISPLGTTIGVFRPLKDSTILLMYPAKIAAAIALGKGRTSRSDLKEVLAMFSAELDIEYRFGMFTVRTFGGTGKLTMRQAADLTFSNLRTQGYSPAPGSEQQLAEFDHLFAPDHHESFWIKPDGITRVEFERRKNGQVRINLHEDQDRTIEPRS